MKIKIYTLALILVNSIAAFGQTPGWEWAVKAGDQYATTVPRDIVTDAYGNIYVTGHFAHNAYFGNILLTSLSGTEDIFLAKYDASGNALWVKQPVSSGYEQGKDLTVDHNGNVYITGDFEGDSITFDNITLHNSSPWWVMDDTRDMFVVKYDASGNVKWAKSAGGWDDGDIGQSIAVDSKGQVYVTGGASSSSITFDSLTIDLYNLGGYFLVKYDSVGNRQWVKIGTEGGPDPGFLLMDSHDNLYLAGTFYGPRFIIGEDSLFDDEYPYNTSSTIAVKFDSAGNVLWERGSNPGGGPSAWAASLDANDNLYLAGIYGPNDADGGFDTINLPPVTAGFFMVKYDASGNLMLVKADGVGGEATGIVSDGNAIYVIGRMGDTISFGNITLTVTAESSATFLAKYDYSGNVEWARSIDAADDNGYGASCITTDANGHLYIAGHFMAPSLNFGTTTLTNYPQYNVALFLARLSDTITCSANFSLFPDTLIPHHYWGFVNSSGIAPLNYYWSWGDGSYDTIQYPSHTYAAAGFYDICLTTGDATGCSGNYCFTYDIQKLSSAEGENTIITVNVVDSIPGIPTALQNTVMLQSWSLFPNPASGNSFINYTLLTPGKVSIDLFDVLGSKLQQLVNAEQGAGEHNAGFDAGKLANGIYVLRIRAGDQTVSQRMVIMN